MATITLIFRKKPLARSDSAHDAQALRFALLKVNK
jgi:hypothetical protein